MARAGGIIALIAGILAMFAALITLFFGGIGSALEADGGTLIVTLGWVGLLGSFAIIVMGAVGMGAKTIIPGVVTISLSIASAIFGGTLVAVFMLLSVIFTSVVYIFLKGCKYAYTQTNAANAA